MGMGKTIQMLSLLLSHPRKKPSLIVCPTVAILQWESEINTHTKAGTFKVAVFHGTSKLNSQKEILEHDIILTTYAIIESSFRRENYGFIRRVRFLLQNSLLIVNRFLARD
jgi:DNA repair protein RAD16